MSAGPPIGLLAELTHRCPLQCPYCSNPIDLVRAEHELSTDDWARVFAEAAALGVLQLHLSGGEPMARKDIVDLVAAAAREGLYTNLITSGVTLDSGKAESLKAAGLDHVQISVQGVDPARADRLAAMEGAAARKAKAALAVKQAGLALTLNAPIHRQNADEVEALIEMALQWDAERLEVAHIQYYGWGLANRASLLPTRAQLDETTAKVERARAALRGQLVIDYVIPDYHAERPKACMGGWGRQVIVVTPDGRALPCHAADTIPGLTFQTVRQASLAAIWASDPAFLAYRGTGWIPEPCRSCDQREIDWGGCRCQALALTGNAANTDPACQLSPHHSLMREAAEDAGQPLSAVRFRRFGG